MTVQDRPARRETSDEAWASWNDQGDQGKSASERLDDRILAMLRAAPEGLTDEQMQRVIDPAGTSVHANRRHLVERGLVRWTGRKLKQAGRVSARIWTLGTDTPEERVGIRRWPEVYVRLREAADNLEGMFGDGRLLDRLPQVLETLRQRAGDGEAESSRETLLTIAALCIGAYGRIGGTAEDQRA